MHIVIHTGKGDSNSEVATAKEWVQQGKMLETTAPNKASKLYLDAAKAFAQHHYIKSASEALHKVAALQSSGALGVKIQLYLGMQFGLVVCAVGWS